MATFNIGEKLVWIHVDEDTGQRVNDFVRVMKVPDVTAKSSSAKAQYSVQVLRTNEPAIAFVDELFRWEK